MKFLILTACFIFCSLISESQRLKSTILDHYKIHKGFFLSMSLGPNFTYITDKDDNNGNYLYSGVGSIFDLKVGGAITQNLLAHGTYIGTSLTGPNVKLNGESEDVTNDLSIGESFIGGGLTYYMNYNEFFSLSLGLSNFNLEYDDSDNGNGNDNDLDVSTDKGFGFQIKIGKEWWISRKWALGCAISYFCSDVKNNYSTGSQKFNSDNIGFVFNATLN